MWLVLKQSHGGQVLCQTSNYHDIGMLGETKKREQGIFRAVVGDRSTWFHAEVGCFGRDSPGEPMKWTRARQRWQNKEKLKNKTIKMQTVACL